MKNNVEPAPLQALQEKIAPREKQILADLRKLVEIESPSDDKLALDSCGKLLLTWATGAGAKTRIHRHTRHGDHLEISFPGAQGEAPLLLLGHFDTVWPMGTLAQMPFQVKSGRAWGPGVYDMKAGIVFAFHALAAVREVRGELPRPVTLLLVSDEEIGSGSSRELTESVAQRCAAVYVLEPAQGKEGSYKTWRKGISDYGIKVTGRSAHAGVDFGKGANAIVEMSRQIAQISELTDLEKGITVSVGTIQGGTRTNVVPEECRAHFDVRAIKTSHSKQLDKRFKSLKPFDPNCRIEVTGGINRPPMERSKRGIALFMQAKALADRLGFTLTEAGTGGGSDGNFTAALGIPTLDGMGAVGEGAHAAHESIFLKHIVPRTTLLAGMLQAELE